MNKGYFTLYCALLTAAAGLAAAAGYAMGKREAEQSAQARIKGLKREWRAQFRDELLAYADRVAPQDEDEEAEEDVGEDYVLDTPESPSAWDERDGEAL